jgi:putative ABC transport system substrate-binding protein
MAPRALLLILALLLAAAPPAPAQSRSDRLRDLATKKVSRIALLGLQPRPGAGPFIHALEKGLTELGYVPGQSVVVEYHSAEGHPDRVGDLGAHAARTNPDVIVASTNELIQSARRATTTIPIIMALAGDPVGAGFVASLARPGGNITGLTFDAVPEAYAKPLEFLKEMQPRTARVAVLRNPDPTFRRMANATLSTGRQLGIAITLLEVRDPGDFDPALAAVRREGIRAVLVWPNGIVYGARRQLIARAMKDDVAVISIVRQFTEDGGLLSYGPSIFDTFERVALYVDRILKGAKPGDLPVEQPTRFELVINMKTANTLGLTVPPALVIRADHVIR